jgi:hypothetical protein
MRRIILPFWLHHTFQHYLTNDTIFGKKLLNIKCVLIVSTISSETVLILRKILRDIINVHRSSCKVPATVVVIYWNLTILYMFSKKKNQNPCRGSQVVPCGRTDMTKLTIAFRNFANAPENLQQDTVLWCHMRVHYPLCILHIRPQTLSFLNSLNTVRMYSCIRLIRDPYKSNPCYVGGLLYLIFSHWKCNFYYTSWSSSSLFQFWN